MQITANRFTQCSSYLSFFILIIHHHDIKTREEAFTNKMIHNVQGKAEKSIKGARMHKINEKFKKSTDETAV